MLTKPFDDQALLDAVYQALDRESVRRPSARNCSGIASDSKR